MYWDTKKQRRQRVQGSSRKRSGRRCALLSDRKKRRKLTNWAIMAAIGAAIGAVLISGVI